jgi:hypothetical protein
MGQLVADDTGGLVAELDACFGTCYGELAGALRVRLAESGDGTWLIEARRARVGLSGFEVSGAWDARPEGFRDLQIAPRTSGLD